MSILKYYVDLNCSVVSFAPGRFWVPIHQHQRAATFFDLEKKYGLVRKLDEVDNPYFRTAYQEKRTVLGEYQDLGFYDLFVPVVRNGRCLGMVISGVFSNQEWTRQKLEESWLKISRQETTTENPGFLEFVKIALETPVLEGDGYLAYREATENFAQILSGEKQWPKTDRFHELKVKVFSKVFPHSFWLDWALGRKPVMQAWGIEVQELDWVQEEIGITRIPTTVIAAIPIKLTGGKVDPVAEMLRIHNLQRLSFNFARTLPQTVCGKLENYGVVFVTSADLSKNRLQRRNQIEDTARKIHRFAIDNLGGPALVGIGETVAPGEPLNRSYRQAVLALHLGSYSGKELVFFNAAREPEAEGLSELRRVLLELKRQFVVASYSDMEMVLDGYLKMVLTLSFRSPDEIRWHLQYALIQLVEAVRDRSDLHEQEANWLHQNLARTLEKAVTTQEMVLAFRESLSKLSERFGKFKTLKAVYSIEKTRDYIDGHFREPLRVSRLAKFTGVSSSTFSRRFKRLTGMGLETYVQKLRLGEAKRLLKTSGLPVARIGQYCGFKSASYFIHLFQNKIGLSPRKFRQK